MTDGIAALRGKKANRATRQAPPPRHPMTPGVAAEFDKRGDQDGEPQQAAPSAPEPPAPPRTIVRRPQADPDAAVPAPVAPETVPAAASAGRAVAPDTRTLPDLNIDWSDALMHVASPTRVSVANSVVARFKAVADQPGVPPQTQLIMEAVSQHLEQLPELVLKRRPEEDAASGPAGFFVRRAPVQRAEPWLPLYMRPMAGEVEALRRIVEWVDGIILDGHPGRQKTSRSEVVTAALDASYPA